MTDESTLARDEIEALHAVAEGRAEAEVLAAIAASPCAIARHAVIVRVAADLVDGRALGWVPVKTAEAWPLLVIAADTAVDDALAALIASGSVEAARFLRASDDRRARLVGVLGGAELDPRDAADHEMVLAHAVRRARESANVLGGLNSLVKPLRKTLAIDDAGRALLAGEDLSREEVEAGLDDLEHALAFGPSDLSAGKWLSLAQRTELQARTDQLVETARRALAALPASDSVPRSVVPLAPPLLLRSGTDRLATALHLLAHEAHGRSAHAVLQSVPPLELARYALTNLRAHAKDGAATIVIGEAVSAARDLLDDELLARVTAEIVRLASPRATRILYSVADRTPVLAAMVQVLGRDQAEAEIEMAASVLAHAQIHAQSAAAHLVARTRTDRGRDVLWRTALYRALGSMRRDEALPTLLLELASEPAGIAARALESTIDCGALSSAWRERVLALPGAGDAARIAYDPDPIVGATSTIADQRTRALADLHQRCHPDELLACGLANELDAALIKLGHPRVVREWAAWRKAVPGLPKDNRERPLWIREHAPALAEQRMTPALARVLDQGAEVVAASFAPSRLILTADERADLERREAAVASVVTPARA